MGEDGDKTLNENCSSKNRGHSLKRLFVSVSFVLYLFNIWGVLNTQDGKFLFSPYYAI